MRILILSDGGSFELTKAFFSDPSFNIVNSSPGDSSNPSQEDTIYKTLRPDDSLLIVRDTSTTVFSPADITSIANQIAKEDFVYLGRWEDRCYLHRSPVNLTQKLKLVNVYSVGGFQALYLSAVTSKYLLDHQNDRDPSLSFGKYLKTLLEGGKLKAKALIPNVFTYDYNTYATTRDDFNRTTECINVVPLSDTQSPNPQTYFYIAGIIGLVCVCGYGLYLLGPKTAPSGKDDGGD